MSKRVESPVSAGLPPRSVQDLVVVVRARTLRKRAVSVHSPVYQPIHKGPEDRALHALPILTNKELMQSWEDIVTDRSLHLQEIQRFLEVDGVPGRLVTRAAVQPISVSL